MLQSADILICKDGAGIGKVGIVGKIPSEATINSSLLLIRSGPAVEPKFLYHCLCSPYFQEIVRSKLEGATTPHLYQREIKRFPIPLPPLDEQKRIVAVLDEAFEGLDRARANAEANLADARELCSRTMTVILRSRTETSIKVRLEEVSQRITKGSSPKWQGISYVDQPGTLFVTSENVKSNKMDFTVRKYVDEKFNQVEPRSILKCGDVLANIVGASIGRAAVYDENEIANINQAVCLIRCEPNFLLGDYLSFLLNSDTFLSMQHNGKTDMARANLSLAFFRELSIPLPSIEEQRAIVGVANAVLEELTRLEHRCLARRSDLATLRQSLLQKAFSGELG